MKFINNINKFVVFVAIFIGGTQAHAQNWQNQSVFTCGHSKNQMVFSSVDILTELFFFNALAPDFAVPLTTDWNHITPFSLPSAVDAKDVNNQQIMSRWSADVKRIFFICLSWQRSGGPQIQNKEAQTLVAHWRSRSTPWPQGPDWLQTRWKAMDDLSLEELAGRVLVALDYLKKQGDLEQNPTLWYTPISWNVVFGVKS